MTQVPLAESDLLPPILALFPSPSFKHLEQVPLGRKRIDLVCLQTIDKTTLSVELKIANWKRALWQAVVNMQLADQSFVALWHEFIPRALRHSELISSYGVGIISVDQSLAQIVLPCKIRSRRIPKSRKTAWYQDLLSQTIESQDCSCGTT